MLGGSLVEDAVEEAGELGRKEEGGAGVWREGDCEASWLAPSLDLEIDAGTPLASKGWLRLDSAEMSSAIVTLWSRLRW